MVREISRAAGQGSPDATAVTANAKETGAYPSMMGRPQRKPFAKTKPPVSGIQRFFQSLRPQIGMLHLIVCQQISRRTLQDNRTGFQHIRPMGNGERHLGILLHQKDSGTSLY